MASGVEELLDMLFEMIDEAKNAAFTSDKCVIERDRALDLIDDIRSQFPIELAEAQKIMANRNELMASAKREAESIRKAAEDKARQLLSEDLIATLNGIDWQSKIGDIFSVVTSGVGSVMGVVIATVSSVFSGIVMIVNVGSMRTTLTSNDTETSLYVTVTV